MRGHHAGFSRGAADSPKDRRLLAYASGKFLGLKINTNAWFLDERKCHALLRAGVSTLVFSADAASEPLYSQLRVKGKLDRVLANIRLFQEIRARHYPDAKTITRVSGVKFRKSQNLDEMEEESQHRRSVRHLIRCHFSVSKQTSRVRSDLCALILEKWTYLGRWHKN
ncbi:radical SAM protein [Acidobacteria bacterium AH-259-D05]|nr:radical SAM protein [Acidobacteria bacterium AH-259-D05]